MPAAAIEAVYRRKGTVLLEIGDVNDNLHIIRRGAVEAHDRHGSFVGRYGERESFGLTVAADRQAGPVSCIGIG